MLYIKLYFAFFQIGVLAFGGGYAALPLIEKFIVEKYNFIDVGTMVDIVSISQMTPGPIAINAATFVGTATGGILGSIIATMGVVTPQVIIITLFVKLIGFQNKYVTMMLDGVNVAVIALISIVSIKFFETAVYLKFNYITAIVFIAGLYLYYKKYDMIKLIIISAIIGVLGVMIGA